MKRLVYVLAEAEIECGDEMCVACDKWYEHKGKRRCMISGEYVELGFRTQGCKKAERRHKELSKS